MKPEIHLHNLVGKWELSGVDFSVEKIANKYDEERFEECQCCHFVLNGQTYTAQEDPNDGYRSALRKIKLSNRKVKNTFPPVEVVGVLIDDWLSWQVHDLICFVDVISGRQILIIGTRNTNDYYPCYTAEWTPENLNINSGVPKNG